MLPVNLGNIHYLILIMDKTRDVDPHSLRIRGFKLKENQEFNQ